MLKRKSTTIVRIAMLLIMTVNFEKIYRIKIQRQMCEFQNSTLSFYKNEHYDRLFRTMFDY